MRLKIKVSLVCIICLTLFLLFPVFGDPAQPVSTEYPRGNYYERTPTPTQTPFETARYPSPRETGFQNGPRNGESPVQQRERPSQILQTRNQYYGGRNIYPINTLGSILVTSIPTGASVYVDNDYKGVTPSRGNLEIPDLYQGTYYLVVHYPGYEDFIQTVYVTGGETTDINCALSPTVTPAPASGSLTIQSTPDSAGILLNNEYKGITPVTLKNINPGNYTLILQKQGYEDNTLDVQVNADQNSIVSVSLAPVVITQTTTPTPVPTASVPVPTPTKSGLPAGLIIIGLVAACILVRYKK